MILFVFIPALFELDSLVPAGMCQEELLTSSRFAASLVRQTRGRLLSPCLPFPPTPLFHQIRGLWSGRCSLSEAQGSTSFWVQSDCHLQFVSIIITVHSCRVSCAEKSANKPTTSERSPQPCISHKVPQRTSPQDFPYLWSSNPHFSPRIWVAGVRLLAARRGTLLSSRDARHTTGPETADTRDRGDGCALRAMLLLPFPSHGCTRLRASTSTLCRAGCSS